MKLVSNTNKFKSNIDNVESQNFGIGDASVVIDILRNRLYKNKIQTLVQEYICNGRDAMREINSDKDIVITSPTRFSPTFKVRDYGPGITPDRMATVFVNYGASTKRTNNKQTGGFGIGAKSAWSYTDTFTIVTYVDGTKRTYVAHTGKNNNGSLDLIETTTTTEVNGTEIQIAVNNNNISEFQDAITRCVFFWDKGYDVKGMELKHFHTKGEMFNKYLEINVKGNFPRNIKAIYTDDVICTIDDIPYKLTSFVDKIDSLKKIKRIVNGDFIVHIPNGLVEVSANREEISDSEHTIKYLTRLMDQTHKELNDNIQAHFKDITSPYGYLQAYQSYQGKFNLDSYRTFGDYCVTRSGKLESKLFRQVKFYKVFYDRKGKFHKHCVNTDTRQSLNQSNYDVCPDQKNRLFYNESESAVKVGQRLRKYLESHDNAILIENNGDDKAFKQAIKDLNFKNITTIALPAKVKKAKVKRTAKGFCMHQWGRYRKETFHTTLGQVIDKWYYVEMQGNSLPNDLYGHKLRQLEGIFDINICALSKSSVKIVKGDKNFKPLQPLIDNYKPLKKHLDWVIKRNAKQYNVYSQLKQLKGIKDAEINKLIKLYNTISKDVESLPRGLTNEMMDKIHNHQSVLAFKKADAKISDIYMKYPILVELSVSFVADNKDYVASILNMKNKGGKK